MYVVGGGARKSPETLNHGNKGGVADCEGGNMDPNRSEGLFLMTIMLAVGARKCAFKLGTIMKMRFCFGKARLR